MKILLIGGAAALVLGGAAFAQDRPNRGDADGDGRVSQAEFIASAAARFEQRDTNRDGVILPDEAQASRDARRSERRDQMFAALDTDGNDQISRTEFDARAEHRGGRGEFGRGDRRRGGHGRGEHGGRGGIAADGVTRAEAETRAAERFARMDVNNDGFISIEDRQARREARRGSTSE